MFFIRRALNLTARLAYNEYSVSHRHTLVCKNGIETFRSQSRFFHEDDSNRKELGKLEGKMKLMFTCKKCSTRNSRLISKLAYNKGVVIVRCNGCKNNHLIADNLGWFPDVGTGKGINIERIMAAKGESVRKIANDAEGYIEAVVNEEFKLYKKNASEAKDSDNEDDKVKKNEITKERES